MGELGPLIWKEWRDARRLVIGAMIVSVVGAYAVHELWFGYLYARETAEILMPALLGLFVAAIASDLVSGDVATRRMETLAMLPVSVDRIWSAKVVFLALASAGFALWVVLVELVLTVTFGPPRATGVLLDHLVLTLPWMAAVLALGAAVTLFSTVLERGFASVLSGIAVIGALYALARSVNISYYGIEPLPQVWVPAVLVLGAVFLGASRAAFVRGPIHHGRKARVGALGMAVALGCLLPLGGGAAWALTAYQDVAPGLDTNSIERLSCSEDGRYLAVQVTSTRGFLGRPRSPRDRGDYAARVWVIDLETDELREISGRATQLHDDPTPWDDDGNLRVWTRESTSVSQAGVAVNNTPLLERTVDPKTGETVGSSKIHSEPRRGGPHPPGPGARNAPWAATKGCGSVPGVKGSYRVEVTWTDQGISRVFDCMPGSNNGVVPSGEPGVVFVKTRAGLVRHALRTGEEALITRGEIHAFYPSPDGKRLYWYDGNLGGYVVLDARSGERVAGPFEHGAWPDWPPGFSGSRYLFVSGRRSDGAEIDKLVDLRSGHETSLASGTEYAGRLCLVQASDDRIITARGAGPIVLRELDGKTVRVIYGEKD